MNILPKKSWHVRNKDNIERVRKDEEKAADEEKERQRRIALAESEARTNVLRQKARTETAVFTGELAPAPSTSTSGHINFFEEFELGNKVDAKNAEHEAEKREEKERQEKAIGLLTYLGQGSVELDGVKPWYFNCPEKRKIESDKQLAAVKSKEEVAAKKKRRDDPMKYMDIYVDQSKKVRNVKEGKIEETLSHKSHKNIKDCSRPVASKTIEQLRAERLRREQNERERSRQLLAKMHGPPDTKSANEQPLDDRSRRYNSQFNPEIARRSTYHDERDRRV